MTVAWPTLKAAASEHSQMTAGYLLGWRSSDVLLLEEIV
jgi:hypothetical protein